MKRIPSDAAEQPRPNFIRIWLDHPRIGCGWRRAIVLRVGPKWVRLMFYPNEAITIPREAFERARPLRVDIDKRRVGRQSPSRACRHDP